MGTHVTHSDQSRAHQVKQAIKWTIYILLLINFGFYIAEDWGRALHTLDADSTFLDWTGEFATSIDESAWFILLLASLCGVWWRPGAASWVVLCLSSRPLYSPT